MEEESDFNELFNEAWHSVWATQIEMFWKILNNTVFMIGVGERLYLCNFSEDVNKFFWKHVANRQMPTPAPMDASMLLKHWRLKLKYHSNIYYSQSTSV